MDASNKGAVAVYGAYGHTGRFIVAELLRRGWQPIACGRDAGKLAELLARFPGIEGRIADVAQPRELDRALDGTVAVINAAGPFMDTTGPVLEAAMRAGIHYFDTSAEQRAAFDVFEHYGERVREAGIVAMPSVAFYGALADLLATAALGDWPDAESIDIAVGLDSWHPTGGTRVTGARNHWRRWIVADGALSELPDPAPTRQWRFPSPLGEQEVVLLTLSEIVSIARHLRAENVRSYMNQTPLRDLRDPGTPAPVASDEHGRSAQTFVLDVQVQRNGQQRGARVQGRDIYAVSAPLIVEAMERVVAGGEGAPGARSAGEAFDARQFLSSLAPDAFSLQVEA
ncbi:saccharopine dehydrogenase family protein [Lysobacter panacisoli]|uniref:Saccharopine dehydrogenase NADP-binding domain-containing protein n=1 Tax=Lysobacter panacisoli TaxID=1255263 RepID=A0ABP9LM04_9GAMM|nr:saccharopine dehydrogenase NADP-binding domain-containing protein [Lysobacter panacisoli]